MEINTIHSTRKASQFVDLPKVPLSRTKRRDCTDHMSPLFHVYFGIPARFVDVELGSGDVDVPLAVILAGQYLEDAM